MFAQRLFISSPRHLTARSLQNINALTKKKFVRYKSTPEEDGRPKGKQDLFWLCINFSSAERLSLVKTIGR